MPGGGLGTADDLSDQYEPGSGSLLSFLTPSEHGLPAPIFSTDKTNRRALRLGLVGLLVTVQLFFYLETIVQSPIFPGNWGGLQGDFQFYLLLDALAFFVLGLSNRVDRIQRGSFAGFAVTYTFFAAGTWLLVCYLISVGQPAVAPLSGTVRLQDFVFYGIFVGPSEELFFRVALPAHVPGGFVSANVAFAAFHVFAYSTSGTSLGVSLGVALVEAFLIGVLLYAVYRYFGYGAAVGCHTAYDLSVAAVITIFGVTGLHLGLIPV
jgi:hypothetical protein